MTTHGNKWVSTNLQDLNDSNFSVANKEYLKAIGELHYRNLIVKSFVPKK